MNQPLRQAKFLIAETDFARLPPALGEVVFIGRSNVGKSSLICGLCDNNGLARVSKMPGRTRGINVFEVKKDKWIIDMPGYGFAKGTDREKDYWPKMIGNYITGRPNMSLVLVLVDGEIGIGPTDLATLQWIREQKVNCRIVGTKVDKMGGSHQFEYRKRMAGSLGLNPEEIHWVSSKKGYGMQALRDEIVSALGL